MLFGKDFDFIFNFFLFAFLNLVSAVVLLCSICNSNFSDLDIPLIFLSMIFTLFSGQAFWDSL